MNGDSMTHSLRSGADAQPVTAVSCTMCEYHRMQSEVRGKKLTELRRALHATEQERRRLRGTIMRFQSEAKAIADFDTGPWIMDMEW